MQGTIGDAIGGEMLGPHAEKVKTFPRGRVCEHPGCTARLSIYNSSSSCALHDFQVVEFRVPRRRRHAA